MICAAQNEMRPPVNIQNIQDFISELRGMPAERFVMGNWIAGEGCNAVCCIGGWFDLLYNGGGDYGDQPVLFHAPDHFRISPEVWHNICQMDFSYGMHTFDRVVPDFKRKEIMISVLEQLLVTGTASWHVALNDHLEQEEIARLLA